MGGTSSSWLAGRRAYYLQATPRGACASRGDLARSWAHPTPAKQDPFRSKGKTGMVFPKTTGLRRLPSGLLVGPRTLLCRGSV